MPQLWESNKLVDWNAAIKSYAEALGLLAASKRDPAKLTTLDKWYLDPKHAAEQKTILKKETLVKIVEWKLSRGTFRPGLLQKAQSNSEKSVKDAAAQAYDVLSSAEKTDAKQPLSCNHASAEVLDAASKAIKALDKNLFGVGPATATAALARAFPGMVAFMSDEAMLGCGLFSKPGDIKYDLKTFSRFNELVQNKARLLNSTLGRREWTGDMVGRALWAHEVLARNAGKTPASATAGAAAKRPSAAASAAEGSAAKVRKTA
eukprot:TRINITY_DN1647_c0_g2_i1.p1 TRINITY_DN1647_c0_g2~~TRINITY_DN1647_c0_g2_i1.p1  ORF type:complete len:262 (-),score=67.43 TRINITY_DN1647_c0_g2_i1:218-1003(-)